MDKNKNLLENKSDYFDHEADIGIIGRGNSVEAAFIGAAEAMFGIMTDLDQINDEHCIIIEYEETDLEFAFVMWLNLLLSAAKENRMVFKSFKLARTQAHWRGEACGQLWQPETTRGTEVKGATLTMLRVRQRGAEWEAKCVVDV